MNKYVFFLETTAPVNGSQAMLLDLAAYMADYTDNEVYYVNNYFKEDISRHEETQLIFSTPDEFDYAQASNAVYFTPVNYMMHLLVRIKDYPDAKICLYQYHSQAVAWLCNNMGNMKALNAVTQFLEDSESRAYLNYTCISPADALQRYEDKIFFPLSLSESMVEFESSDLVEKEVINIGYLGNLNAESSQTLYNLFNNLALMRNGKRTNIHIIGNAGISLNSTFKRCSESLTRVIFTSMLEKEDCEKYIRDNVDLILATNLNAVEAASYGVPVIVPVSDTKPFVGNNYVYLFDINGFIYTFNNTSLLSLNNACFKIDRIIKSIYEEGKKKDLAKQCYDYCRGNNSLEAATENLARLAKQSQLYVKDCLCETNIAECLEKYNEFVGGAGEEQQGFSNYLAHNAALKQNATVKPTVVEESKETETVKKKFTKGLLRSQKR